MGATRKPAGDPQGAGTTVLTAAPSTADAELARRVARCLGRAASALGWKATERAGWEARARAALGDRETGALGLARRIERLAKQLRPPAEAREALRVAALLRVRAGRGRAVATGEFLAAMLGALRKALAFEQATAFVSSPGDGRLTPAAISGAHVDLIRDVAFDHGAGLSSWVAKSRRPVLLSTDREDLDDAGEGRPASFLSVPLVADAELVGVLNLAHRRPGAFTGTDRDFVVLAGGLAAAALSRLRQDPAQAGTPVALAPAPAARA